MKKLIVFLISAVTAFFCIPAFSQTNLIGPPIGLEWGMSYSEAKTLLKSKGIEIEDLKEDKKYKLPKGFKVAKVGKYEILNRKTEINLACFNADGELCSFQINFRWFKDKEKALVFYEKELKKAFYGKYSGEGFKEHKDPSPEGNIPAFAFRDEVGNEVGVYHQDQKTLLGDAFWILVYYNNEEILKATRKQQKATDEI